jgi:hypothetical protein
MGSRATLLPASCDAGKNCPKTYYSYCETSLKKKNNKINHNALLLAKFRREQVKNYVMMAGSILVVEKCTWDLFLASNIVYISKVVMKLVAWFLCCTTTRPSAHVGILPTNLACTQIHHNVMPSSSINMT